jgi:hypothetical protein
MTPKTKPAKTRLLLAIGAASAIVSGCSRPDLVTSHVTASKARLLQQDPMYRAPFGAIEPADVALITAGSAGEGPGDWSTTASRDWRSATITLNATTMRGLAAYLDAHDVVALTPRCAPHFWWVVGLKQYGPWVANITAYVSAGQLQIRADMGVGDQGRATLADAERQQRATDAESGLDRLRCPPRVQRTLS